MQWTIGSGLLLILIAITIVLIAAGNFFGLGIAWFALVGLLVMGTRRPGKEERPNSVPGSDP